MVNKDLRVTAAGAGVRLWQIAEELHITDSTFSRRLRKELPAEDKKMILDIIERLKNEVE